MHVWSLKENNKQMTTVKETVRKELISQTPTKAKSKNKENLQMHSFTLIYYSKLAVFKHYNYEF